MSKKNGAVRYTSRESLSVELYLNDLRKYPVLSPEDELLIFKRVKNNDEAALRRFICCNAKFVVTIAKQFQNRGVPLADLIAEGNLGLISSVNKYDETKGFKFISFAVWYIKQAMWTAIVNQNRTVRLPISKVVKIARINKVKADLEQELERVPTLVEISEKMNLREEQVVEYLEGAEFPVHLESCLNPEEGRSLYDVMEDSAFQLEKDHSNDHRKQVINSLLKYLSTQQCLVITMYYGLNGQEQKTLEEIADIMDRSKERVRQIKDEAKRLLAKRAAKLMDMLSD